MGWMARWAGGVLIADIAVDSPSAQAGLQPGDVITAADGHAIEGSEEKAVASYSAYLEQLEHTSEGARQAPVVAVNYWHLPATATLRDVVGRIRDDECRHRDVNHAMAEQIASGCRSGFDESR